MPGAGHPSVARLFDALETGDLKGLQRGTSRCYTACGHDPFPDTMGLNLLVHTVTLVRLLYETLALFCSQITVLIVKQTESYPLRKNTLKK